LNLYRHGDFPIEQLKRIGIFHY